MTDKSVPKIAVRLIAIALIQTFVLGWMVWDRVTLLGRVDKLDSQII